MDRIPVSSTDLASVGYDPSGILEVEFLKGGIYQYSGVPMDIYVGLMNAPSKGKFFNEYIKKGGFPFNRVA